MRKLFLFLLLPVLLAGCAREKKPKYVFYFIGDGLSLCQINATEAYLAEKKGKIGNETLCFTEFPYVGYATTFCSDRYVTDSAAAGTALATGEKTSYGTMGMDSARILTLVSIAEKARQAGMKSGVMSSVSVDHATPGAFYGHQPDRNMYYEIALDGIKADLDFYAGGGYVQYVSKKDPASKNVLTAYAENGYTVLRGMDAFDQVGDTVKKVVLIQREGKGVDFPYAIDREADDMTLAGLVKAAIKVLSKGDKGFFMMAEGGKIDWANHSNDGATCIREILDFDEAIRVAYEFYTQHPDETLIVIAQDHETGGMTLCAQPKLTLLDHQTGSLPVLESSYARLRTEKPLFSWDDAKAFLTKNFGFWDDVKLTENDEKTLSTAFESENNKVTEAKQKPEFSYADFKYELVSAAGKMLNNKAGLRWTTVGHTGIPTMVYAIGPGAAVFTGKQDNTDIPKKIETLMLK